jgi:hypothetical protein
MAFVKEVFLDISLDDLRQTFYRWTDVGLINDQTGYEEATERESLLEFSYDFLSLMDALYLIYQADAEVKERRDKLSDESKELLSQENLPEYLPEDQVLKPMQYVKDFFGYYPIVYVRRELWDLFVSVLDFDGYFVIEIQKGMLGFSYEWFVRLADAA